jgi:hypothetical protein
MSFETVESLCSSSFRFLRRIYEGFEKALDQFFNGLFGSRSAEIFALLLQTREDQAQLFNQSFDYLCDLVCGGLPWTIPPCRSLATNKPSKHPRLT